MPFFQELNILGFQCPPVTSVTNFTRMPLEIKREKLSTKDKAANQAGLCSYRHHLASFPISSSWTSLLCFHISILDMSGWPAVRSIKISEIWHCRKIGVLILTSTSNNMGSLMMRVAMISARSFHFRVIRQEWNGNRW